MEVSQQKTQRLESIHLPGEIRWQRVARSRAIRKIIEKSIARWAQLQRICGAGKGAVPGGGELPRYRAVLQREGDGHLVHCQIEVISGSEAWFGSRVGQGIQQALADCLAHMRRSSLVLPEPQPLT